MAMPPDLPCLLCSWALLMQDYKGVTLVVRASELRPWMYLVRGKDLMVHWE